MDTSASLVVYNDDMPGKHPMTMDENDDGEKSGRGDDELDAAEELLDEFLARLEDGETLDFSTFAGEHPELESELRTLYEDWSRLDARLETALPETVLGEESFFQSVAWSVSGPGSLQLPAGHAEARPGASIGDYRLIRLLGQGGMGQVWEAEEETLGRRVALKLIRPDKYGRDVVRQLSREARASSRLDHPCIVTVYAAGEADGVPFIAQQLVGTGFHLGDAIARMRDAQHPIAHDYRQLASLFAQVAEALAVAHEAGVLHRDLKPQNILIGSNDVPAVTDFGLAHVSSDDGASTKPGLVGTYPYMSPEQAAGKGKVDARSDIFSLGAVLFEALTLRRAFEGDTAGQILERIQRHDPPDARVLRSRVPRDLAVICAKALAKSPSDRYASMSDFAADLRRSLSHEPIHARPEGPLRHAVKWITRHPALSTGLVLSTVALITIALMLVREVDLRRAAEQERARANEQDYLARLRASQQHIARREFVDAHQALMSIRPEQRGWEWGHESMRANMSLQTLDVADDAVPYSSLSFDAGRAATSDGQGAIVVWDMTTGERIASWSFGHGGSILVPIALSSDGTTLIAGRPSGRLSILDVDTGDVIREHVQDSSVLSVAISSDGSTSASGGALGEISVWGETEAPLTQLSSIVTAPIVSLAMSADGSRLVTGNRNGIVEDWLIEDESVGQLTWYGRGPTYVAITADGHRAFGAKADGQLMTWDISPEALAVIEESDDPDSAAAYEDVICDLGVAFEGLSVSADGMRLATISNLGRSLRLWDRRVDEPLAELTGLDGLAMSVAFSPDGTQVAATSDRGHLASFDGTTRTGDVVLRDFPGTVTALAMSDNAKRFVSATTATSRVLLWDQDAERQPQRLIGHTGSVVDVAIDARGKTAVSGGFDTTVRVWDVDSGTTSAVLEGHAGGIESLAISANGERIASASRDKTVRLWSGEQWSDVAVMDAHEAVVVDVDISADGRRAVSSSYDGSVVLWLPDEERTIEFERNEWFNDSVVAISADGRRIATGSVRRNLLLIYAVERIDGELVCDVVIERRTNATALAISARGDRLVSSSFNDHDVRVWDLQNGEALALLDGHGASVECVAMSGDGTRIASGSSDETVILWESTSPAARSLWHALDRALSR